MCHASDINCHKRCFKYLIQSREIVTCIHYEPYCMVLANRQVDMGIYLKASQTVKSDGPKSHSVNIQTLSISLDWIKMCQSTCS